jgi:hypothetical protein
VPQQQPARCATVRLSLAASRAATEPHAGAGILHGDGASEAAVTKETHLRRAL